MTASLLTNAHRLNSLSDQGTNTAGSQIKAGEQGRGHQHGVICSGFSSIQNETKIMQMKPGKCKKPLKQLKLMKKNSVHLGNLYKHNLSTAFPP